LETYRASMPQFNPKPYSVPMMIVLKITKD
jgi:hypothetical protein